jgi:hypothetical protein
MGLWLLIAVVVGIAAVLLFRRLTKRSFLAGRVPEPLEVAYASVKDQVSFEVFREVLEAIGKAYGMDPRLIRPTDTFSELGKADSWVLGKGEDDLTAWVDRKGLGRPTRLQTVLDLATWLQRATSPPTGARG